MLRIFFPHIPKTSGTSLWRHIENSGYQKIWWQNRNKNLGNYWDYKNQINDGAILVGGHFHAGNKSIASKIESDIQYYSINYIGATIIREPLVRLFSMHAHVDRSEDHGLKPQLCNDLNDKDQLIRFIQCQPSQLRYCGFRKISKNSTTLSMHDTSTWPMPLYITTQENIALLYKFFSAKLQYEPLLHFEATKKENQNPHLSNFNGNNLTQLQKYQTIYNIQDKTLDFLKNYMAEECNFYEEVKSLNIKSELKILTSI